VQTAVDRRFTRRKYNAVRTVEAFSPVSLWLRPMANQAAPMTAAAAPVAPAATGLEGDQSGPDRGRRTTGREDGA
jgi:hypothetical protein